MSDVIRKGEVALIEKYGAQVFCDEEMDNLRRDRCLCLRCDSLMKCGVAHAMYELCKENNLALAMTRCPKWEAK